MNVKVDGFASGVQKLLQEYGDEVWLLVNELVPEVGKEARKQVKQDSPHDTGRYSRGWAVQTTKERLGVSVEVHNKDRYRLTHLLENGHDIKNQYGYVGKDGKRVEARPHIGKVNDWAADELFDRLKRGIESGGTL